MSEEEQDMSDEEALMKLARAMKDNPPSEEDRQSIFSFLFNVATSKDTTKIGNLRDDKDLNEIGNTNYTVRGAKQMALIAEDIMDNDYFRNFFDKEAEITLSSSLSREGFLVRQASTQTKQVADITKRRKINKGWFGKQKVEETGGDTTGSASK